MPSAGPIESRSRVLGALAQALVWGLVRTPPGGRMARVAGVAYRLLRLPLVRAGDPPVRYSLDGRTINLPLSHDLPPVKHANPSYGNNLAELAEVMARKYPDLTAIDVGANVGDTATTLDCGARIPILCAEGERDFIGYLRSNVHGMADVELETSFIGEEPGRLAADVISSAGTARLEPTTNGSYVALRSLEEILGDHRRFAESKLLKVDTDGLDVPIILGAAAFLERARPAIFFEYDPVLADEADAPSFAVFAALRSLGYSTAVCYDNLGEYLVSSPLGDEALLADLHAFAARSPKRYLDICVLHAEDGDIGDELRRRATAARA